MQEKVLETKICKHCNSSFLITDKDLEFYDKVSPIFNGEKYQIPTPTLCPDCRQQRRLCYRNESKLYRRKCDATGKDLISIYSPVSSYIVYDNEYWWGDKWDAMDFNHDIDYSRMIFEQICELRLKVPRLANNLLDDENTHFSNQCWHIKNSYLCFNVGYSEDCLYSHEVYHSKNIIDCLDIKNSEFCYESFLYEKCFKCFFIENCENCYSCYFSYDCRGCNDVFLCTNLRNKKYCIRNKQYTPFEYKKEVANILTGNNNDINNLISEFQDIKKKSIHNENSNLNSLNSSGDYLNEVKNCSNCFNIIKSEDCKFVYHGDGGQIKCYDLNYVAEVEKSYEGAMVAGYNNLFCFMVVYGKYNIYCDLCMYSENCFLCVGLKYKKYCIFNKQYTREQYEELVPKIIEHMKKTGEWGEFFPSSISPFGYNESVANEYFPVSPPLAPPYQGGEQEEEIPPLAEEQEKIPPLIRGRLGGGFNWSTYEALFPKVEKIIPAKMLPDNISDIPDDILNRAIECEITKKPFRIIKQELDFYRKHNLVIPRRHPDQRHLDRMALRNPRKLFDRKCDKCGKDIKTTYSPERSELVYCEECYNKEIY